jgi:hypothetical protein
LAAGIFLWRFFHKTAQFQLHFTQIAIDGESRVEAELKGSGKNSKSQPGIIGWLFGSKFAALRSGKEFRGQSDIISEKFPPSSLFSKKVSWYHRGTEIAPSVPAYMVLAEPDDASIWTPLTLTTE